MIKSTILFCAVLTLMGNAKAQKISDLLKKVKVDSSHNVKLNKVLQTAGLSKTDSLSSSDVISGLKQALEIGAKNSSDKLSVVDGFFANAALKILLPPEAVKVEKTLRNLGMGKLVDDAILAMNRAAEDASSSAAPIFINAIKQMSIQDAFGILRGTDTAATGYLRSKTLSPLTTAFRPVIENSLQKVNATKYWGTMITAYNKISIKKINPDLAGFVTEKATNGIFLQVAEEEKAIRKNPAARVTDLLKKVFNQGQK